ncbi:class I SAM-dependent methyltransferase [Nocardia jinanensis]|uniref:Transferase n=1 Tax=Nocardia jinanensis TaxID=382504 RepID=A0A917RZ64_9NOCA|nr:class I SAM-dependent methyltransferase [Nocardia jinanensis]GGL46476.1 transferase [Nocardia jinanensis]
MTDSGAASKNDSAAADFDQIYRDGDTAGMSFERLPWDIGRPQPLLVQFEEAGRIAGEVLDIGCGPGDTAIYLSSRGYRVTGLDISPAAIDQARHRAVLRGITVTFEVADATSLDGYEGCFDTVVSSQLLHCLEPFQREAHVAALTRVLKPGGRLIQFSFTLGESAQFYRLFSISEEDLRATFTPPEWSIDTLQSGHMEGFKPPEQLMQRFAEHGYHPDFTEDGLMLLPVCVLEARRV